MRHYLLVLLTIVTFSRCAQNKVREPEGDLWKQAFAADSLGHFDKSISLYDKILESDLDEPWDIIALTNRGRAKISSGDTLNGIKDLDKALAITPLYEALLSRGMVESNKTKALDYFHKAKALAPSRPLAYYSFLNYYTFTVPAKDSALYYADYLLKNFESENEKSELLMATYAIFNQYDKLNEIASLIIRNNPRHAFAYNNRGFAKMQLGDFNSAREDINESMSLNPENSYAFRNLGILFLKTNKTDSACIQFSKASALGYKELYGGEIDSLLNLHCKKIAK